VADLPPTTTEKLLLPWDVFNMDRVEQYDQFNFLKGGIVNFRPEVSTTSIAGAILNNQPGTETSAINATFYPGGGIGFHAGPLGIRVDAGDEIYWTNTAHHNLRITFGPTVRF
jgi:hypothetical protein